MRTSKKLPDGAGGWWTVVTTDDGSEVTVELIRGGYKRNWFGYDSYHWSARVSGPDWSHEMLAGHDDSAQRLALRGLHARLELDERAK